MITICTDKGYEFARAEAKKHLGAAHISIVSFVRGEPAKRFYVFRGSVR